MLLFTVETLEKTYDKILEEAKEINERDSNNYFMKEEKSLIKDLEKYKKNYLLWAYRFDIPSTNNTSERNIRPSADRTTNIESVLKRTHSYTTKHYQDLDLCQMVERSYNHMLKKYGGNGYAKNYCYDKDYEQFKQGVEKILKNKWEFTRKYLEVNEIMDLKEKAKLFAINAHMGQIKAYEEFKIYAQKRHKKQGFDTIVRNFDLHILPFFKGRKINELTKLDIIDWQSYILDKKFSNNFNRNLYYIFSSFMNYCVLYLYISENLVLQVEKFKKRFEQKQHIVYSIWQFRRFRFYLNNYVVKQYFNFMYFYGTRPSETMALRFCDLDGKFVCIRHSLQRKGQRNLDTPKNQSSFRTLKISPLTRFRIWLLKKSYYNCKNDYFIFGGNKPLSPTSVDRYKKRLVRKPD